MSKFLSGLSPSLRSQVRGQILGDNILTLLATFFRVVLCQLEMVLFAPLLSRRGKGRGRGRDFGGRESFGGRRGSYGGRQGGFDTTSM